MYSNNAYSWIVGKAKAIASTSDETNIVNFQNQLMIRDFIFWNPLSIEPESIFFRWPLGSSASVKLSFNLRICSCDGFVFCATTFHMLTLLFRIPHKAPAGSLKVLHAPARRGGIRRASQTKSYNLETDEFVSNPPFLKTNLVGIISQHTLGGNN